jgi:hypothetical protein
MKKSGSPSVSVSFSLVGSWRGFVVERSMDVGGAQKRRPRRMRAGESVAIRPAAADDAGFEPHRNIDLLDLIILDYNFICRKREKMDKGAKSERERENREREKREIDRERD